MRGENKNLKANIRVIICVICSVLSVLAMHCEMNIIDGGEDSIILNGIYKFYHSFNTYNFTDIFVFLAVYILICYIIKYDNKLDRWTVAFSMLFSVSYVVSMSYKKYNSAEFLYDDRYQMLLAGVCISGYTILFYLALRLLEIYIESHAKGLSLNRAGKFKKHFLLYSFLIIFISWLPWIFMNYPGSNVPDSTYQLSQYFGDTTLTAHHPPLSTYIMGGCFQ